MIYKKCSFKFSNLKLIIIENINEGEEELDLNEFEANEWEDTEKNRDYDLKNQHAKTAENNNKKSNCNTDNKESNHKQNFSRDFISSPNPNKADSKDGDNNVENHNFNDNYIISNNNILATELAILKN